MSLLAIQSLSTRTPSPAEPSFLQPWETPPCPSCPCLYSHRQQPCDQPAPLPCGTVFRTPCLKNSVPHPGSILKLPSLCLSVLLCRIGVKVSTSQDYYEKPLRQSMAKTLLLFRREEFVPPE